MIKDNGLSAWEQNAEFWDSHMGDDSNPFHRDLVRPSTERLLEVKDGDLILDIACGNGNFSKRLADVGASVVAFDYSPKMIELAKKRCSKVLDKVSFNVCDATDYDMLIKLRQEKPFDKAVANMAIMDISEIVSLFKAVNELLKKDGVFVFSTHHPCFTYPNENYLTEAINKGEAISGQPVLQNYYHRSMEDIFNVAFKSGFIVDGFREVPFEEQKEPIIMIVRLKRL